MRIGFAQINTTVGDFAGNRARIVAAYRELDAAGTEIVVTPELAITGYPPQDLVFKPHFVRENLAIRDSLRAELRSAALVIGFIDRDPAGTRLYNAAAVLEPGQEPQVARKTLLPTYDVFDEGRYFEPAAEMRPIAIRGRKFGVTICEDVWVDEPRPGRPPGCDPPGRLADAGATAILNLSASPFESGKPARRMEMLRALALRIRLPIFYCNAVGGNDHLVFDGNSLAIASDGRLLRRGAAFAEERCVVDTARPLPMVAPAPDPLRDLHDALVLGLRDYIGKSGMTSCLLGLSGGIDSALAACLAVEALGAGNVTGVLLPSQVSSAHSIADAEALAKNLGIRALTIPIRQAFDAVSAQLADVFAGLPEDTTEENLQARLRGMILMALSNKWGSLLLSTGNRSELAVGYCTLYGDMCGGLAILADVPKTAVYRLSRWINERAGREIIPESTLTKPPSAELRPDQTDQDTLPPYEILDEILRLSLEEDLSPREIQERGFDARTVDWILRRVGQNEYKRRQAALGIKVGKRAFGPGRRLPIVQKFPG